METVQHDVRTQANVCSASSLLFHITQDLITSCCIEKLIHLQGSHLNLQPPHPPALSPKIYNTPQRYAWGNTKSDILIEFTEKRP